MATLTRAARRRAQSAAASAPVSLVAIAVALLFVLACALWVAQPGSAYPTGVPQDWLRGGLAIVALSASVAFVRADLAETFSARCARTIALPSPAIFAVVIVLVTVGLSLVFAFYAFNRSASTADEMAQLWHARMLVHGRLSLPADPNPEFFAIDNVVDTGRWYSEYPIGGPAVLAFGVLLRVPWLVNPALAGMSALAMYAFARRVFGEIEGRAIAALFAVCPMILLMSGTYMNHVPVMCLAVCTLAALAEWAHTTAPARQRRFAAVVGLAVGLTATIRPLDAVVIAAAVGAFMLVVMRRDRARVRQLPIVVIAGLVGVAPLLYANAVTTGSAFRFGYEVLWGSAHRLGFHTDPMGTAHTLSRAYQYAIMYVSELNFFLVLWPIPVLAVAVLALASAKRFTAWDALLAGMFWLQVLAYAMYWHQGQFLGPRFLFTAVPAVVVFVARAPFLVGDRFGSRWRTFTLVAVLSSIAATWSLVPWDRSVWGMARLNHDSRRVLKVDYAGAVRDANVGNALVFLREPFGTRLHHRLWGIGMPRGETERLFRASDACSLLSAIRAVENDSTIAKQARPVAVRRAAAPFVRGAGNLRASDATIQISSEASVTDACRAEIADDARLGGAPFGPALPLEPIGPDGRLDAGDVIYASDLGERNELLRARFGNRRWYRLTVVREGDRSLRPILAPY